MPAQGLHDSRGRTCAVPTWARNVGYARGELGADQANATTAFARKWRRVSDHAEVVVLSWYRMRILALPTLAHDAGSASFTNASSGSVVYGMFLGRSSIADGVPTWLSARDQILRTATWLHSPHAMIYVSLSRWRMVACRLRNSTVFTVCSLTA